jgi:biotin operon repressor/predicted phosphodiesterase
MTAIMEIIKALLGVKKVEVEFTDEEKKLIFLLHHGQGMGLVKDLSTAMNKSTAGVIDVASSVTKKGIEIWNDEANEMLRLTGSRSESTSEEAVTLKDKEIKIGFIADSLLGSKFQQLTALHHAHQIAEHEGVDFMIHLGLCAGPSTRATIDEFFLYTAQEQADYIAANYPHSTKYKTRIISGYHDMKWRKERKSENVPLLVCQQRNDLVYRGDLVSDFHLRRGAEKGDRWPVLRAAYRGGDNSPYSKSYPVQGFQETLIQDIGELFAESKTDIGVVAGQGVFLDLSGETVECLVSLPGMRAVPPSVLRKKNRVVAPTLGFAILTIRFTDDGRFFVKKKECYPLRLTKNDYKFKFMDDKVAVAELTGDERKVLELLEESPRSCGELSQALDKSSETVLRVIHSLRQHDYHIEEREASQNFKLVPRPRKYWKVNPIDFKNYFHKTIEEGAVSDTHYGSVVDLHPIQEEAYDVFEARGIEIVNHVGDLTNGSPKHNEHMNGEAYEYRATPLIYLVARKYPRRKKIKTRIVAGNHDCWFMGSVGLDLVRHIADLRPDFDYLGPCEGVRQVGKVLVHLKHYDWGTSFAKSLKPQAVVETILKEVSKELGRYKGKPIIVLSGGGHNYCSMVLKGIVFILMPCLQGPTGFVKRLGKHPDVGFIIFSITYSKDGELTRFSIEYFDRIARSLDILRRRNANEKRRSARISEPKESTEPQKKARKKNKKK